MFLSMFQIFFVMEDIYFLTTQLVIKLAPISSGPGDLLIFSSFNVSNVMFSVTFSSSIANLLFTLDVVGIDSVCSVVNTLEKYSRDSQICLA